MQVCNHGDESKKATSFKINELLLQLNEHRINTNSPKYVHSLDLGLTSSDETSCRAVCNTKHKRTFNSCDKHAAILYLHHVISLGREPVFGRELVQVLGTSLVSKWRPWSRRKSLRPNWKVLTWTRWNHSSDHPCWILKKYGYLEFFSCSEKLCWILLSFGKSNVSWIDWLVTLFAVHFWVLNLARLYEEWITLSSG